MRLPSTPGYFTLRLLSFAGVVALPLLLALVLFHQGAFSTAKSVAQARLTSQAREGAAEVQALLLRAESTLDFLRGREEITKQDWGSCERLLEGMLHIDPMFHNIWVAEPSGKVVCSSFNPDNRQLSFAEEPWFKRALTEPDFVLGEPSQGKFFPRPRSALMTRVEGDGGQALAVISVSLNLEALSNRLRALSSSENNTVTVVNREAFVFARSHEATKFIGTAIPDQTSTMLAAPRATLFSQTGPDGTARLYSAIPVEKYQLYVAAGLPSGEVFAASQAAAVDAVVAFLVALALSILLAYFGARRLTQPLSQLSTAARLQAEGNVTARAPTSLQGEYAAVALEFNRMLDARERSEKMLRHSEARAQRMADFYSALSQANQALSRVRDPQALFDIICATCVESTHAKLAWIGLTKGGVLRSVSVHGRSAGFIENLSVDLDDANCDFQQSPASDAVRSGETVVIDDLWADPASARWLDDYKRLGLRSMVAAPFSQGGQVCGVLCVYMAEASFFDEPLIDLIQELSLAISFGLESRDSERQRDAAKLAEQQALQAKAKAEASDAAKTQFLTRMGHELRTPLNAILGFAQILRERSGHKLDDKENRQLELIFKAGAQLRLLLDDALDFNRTDTGELVFEPQDVDVCALLDDVAGLVSPLATEAGVEVRKDCPQNGLHALVIDPTRLRQVLLNLLSNSIRYNRNGGWVRLAAHEGATGLVFTLEDNGMTLTAEQLARIYEPFTPAGAGGQKVNRSGLGMMLTRQLVEMLGGRLTVESEEGRGTRMRVLLPKLEALRQSREMTEAEEPESVSAALATSGTVLYIEDNHINAVLVQEALAAWPGISVIVAETGEQGLELIRTTHPDLVLLDMQLPDISGLEVLSRLRAQPETKDQRVVVLSASAIPEVRTRAHSAGVLEYWLKPIDFPPLVAGVRRLLAEGRTG